MEGLCLTRLQPSGSLGKELFLRYWATCSVTHFSIHWQSCRLLTSRAMSLVLCGKLIKGHNKNNYYFYCYWLIKGVRLVKSPNIESFLPFEPVLCLVLPVTPKYLVTALQIPKASLQLGTLRHRRPFSWCIRSFRFFCYSKFKPHKTLETMLYISKK